MWRISPQHLWYCKTCPQAQLLVSIYSPSNEEPPSSLHRGSARCSQRLLLTHPERWLQIPPLLFSALKSPHGAEAPARSSAQPFPAGAGTGKGGRAGTLPGAGTFPAGSRELLPSSCVSCPQLNITARNAGDSSVLETERLRLNGSVTEHRLPEHRPGSSYAVTIRGLTAAGAGAALMREFPTGSSGKALLCRCPRSLGTDGLGPAAGVAPGRPCSSHSPARRCSFPGRSPPDTPRPEAIGCRGARDISPSQGTAVLPLRPIARPSEAAR